MLHNPTTENIPTSSRLFISTWGWWALGTLIGGLIGWVIVGISLIFTWGLSFIAFWLVVGACVGSAQYVAFVKIENNVIKSEIASGRISPWPQRGPWVATTIVGILLTVLVADTYARVYNSNAEGSIDYVHSLGPSLIGGLFYGALQSLAFRSKIKVLALWSPICALGWAIGGLVGFLSAQIVMDRVLGHTFEFGEYLIGPYEALYFTISGIIGTLIFGLITGPIIALLCWPKPTPSPPDTPGTPQTAQNDLDSS